MKAYSPNKKGNMVYDIDGKWCSLNDAYEYARQERKYERDKGNNIFKFICDCVINGDFTVKNGGVRFGVKVKKKAKRSLR
jgi:hypothetical protein